MFSDAVAFSGYSVNDLDQAEVFYKDVLGLRVSRDRMGFSFPFQTDTGSLCTKKMTMYRQHFQRFGALVMSFQAYLDNLEAKTGKLPDKIKVRLSGKGNSWR